MISMAEIDINTIAANLKLSTGAADYKEIVTVPMSFETNLLTATRIYFPYKVQINKIRSIVTKAVAATDDGTITGANATGSSTAVVTVAASSALNTEDTATITDNNVVAADSYYSLTSAKTTKGGTVLCTIEYTRI